LKRNKISIITLGCSKNLIDSELLMRQFIASGYTVEHDPEQASGEIVVVNTCGFIESAKEESIETILQFGEAKKRGKIRQLYVMGCLSERYTNDLQRLIPEVDKFYGKFNYRQLLTDLGKSFHGELASERLLTTPSHYAYLKIAEGCNRTCSYCSIPIITGKYKSRTIEEIANETQSIVNQGVKEINLIAQDLTWYGKDIYKRCSIAELVDKISDVEGLKWLRLHYAYPGQFPLDLLSVMAAKPNVCKYLDIALQHSSDRMLNLMRRKITRSETVDLLAEIRSVVPNIHLRTTMMVGHPGETEEDFDDLKSFIRQIRFERLGAFAYSEEENTYSARHYKDEVSSAVKQKRLGELMSIQEQIAAEINETKVGKTLQVVIDREESGFYVGRTEFDSPEVDPEVLITKDKELSVGEFYDVKIIGTEGLDLLGSYY